MPLLEPRTNYAPFEYPWAFEAYKRQNQIHWLPENVPLGEDVKDWTLLNDKERSLLTHIFRFFTQADVEVASNYNTRLLQVFRPPEIQMMLTSFAAMESIHVDAYSLLIKTIGMPETTFNQFMDYKAMKDKHDYFESFGTGSYKEIAKCLAAFGGFVEGVQLFASFAMLFNFSRSDPSIGKRGKMRGMGQIVTYSIRDETLHCQNIIKLFRAFVREHPRIWNDELKKEIYDIAETCVAHEDAFIDLAFEMGGVEGIEPGDVKKYIRYVTDRRLLELGMKNIFKQKTNPLDWMDHILGVEKANFFEAQATEYSHGATRGTWEEAWALHDGHGDVFVGTSGTID
jgi:ribonucleoside-diphosphate reductase beta chain